MKKTLKNDGFSLVELIIVIAIMAILVGVMAPQLIKYIEKTNVSADAQLCDAVLEAIKVSANDPEVLAATDKSSDMIGDMYSNKSPHIIDNYLSTVWTECAFAKNVTEILGFNPFESGTDQHIRSHPACDKGGLMCVASEDGNTIAIFIQHSDKNGKKEDNTYTSDGLDGLEDSGVIYAR